MPDKLELNEEISQFVTEFNLWDLPNNATPEQRGRSNGRPVLILNPDGVYDLLFRVLEKWEAKKNG